MLSKRFTVLILAILPLSAAGATTPSAEIFGQEIVAFAMQSIAGKHGMSCVTASPETDCSRADREPRSCRSETKIECENSELKAKFKVQFFARDYDGEGIYRLSQVSVSTSGKKPKTTDEDYFGSEWMDQTIRFLERGRYTVKENSDWKPFLGIKWLLKRKIVAEGPGIDPRIPRETLKLTARRGRSALKSLHFEYRAD